MKPYSLGAGLLAIVGAAVQACTFTPGAVTCSSGPKCMLTPADSGAKDERRADASFDADAQTRAKGMDAAAGQGGSASGTGGAKATSGASDDDAGTTRSACSPTCTGAKPACDSSSRTCVECVVDDDCSDARKPACDSSAHACVECIENADCSSHSDKPACDVGAHACVRCTRNEDCSASDPVCATDKHQCVQCLADSDCAKAAPVCNTEARSCVQCLRDADCGGSTPVCDTTQHACVQCNQNTDCLDAAQSLCSDHACSSCQADGDCVQISAKHACDDGTCVQCTGSKYADCGKDSHDRALVCDSASRTCSQTATERSVGLCSACITDAQCFQGQLCVQESFGSAATAAGYFCFWKKDATGTGAPGNDCDTVQPFVDATGVEQSIDGTASAICGLRASTCAGYNAFSATSCATQQGGGDDSVCDFTHASTPDAYCRANGSNNYFCTLPCLSNQDCKTGSSCNTQVTPNVCSL